MILNNTMDFTKLLPQNLFLELRHLRRSCFTNLQNYCFLFHHFSYTKTESSHLPRLDRGPQRTSSETRLWYFQNTLQNNGSATSDWRKYVPTSGKFPVACDAVSAVAQMAFHSLSSSQKATRPDCSLWRARSSRDWGGVLDDHQSESSADIRELERWQYATLILQRLPPQLLFVVSVSAVACGISPHLNGT